ncbi:MAG: thioesterase family protein, partial [Polyangiales bacterium]
MSPYFRQLDDERFEALEPSIGPWSDAHLHGGPPSALAAGRLEAVLGETFRVVRLHVEIVRPIPLGELTLRTEIRREGRTVRAASAHITDPGGNVVMTSDALAIAVQELDLDLDPPPLDEAGPDDATPTVLSVFEDVHGYGAAMEVRLARGVLGSGDVMAWFRSRVPLLDGQVMSPLERLMTAADSGNGVSARLNPRETSFINPDLTVALHRYPTGEWIGLAARTDVDHQGVGLADARLYDARG